jgi:hypothetical protein
MGRDNDSDIADLASGGRVDTHPSRRGGDALGLRLDLRGSRR